MSETPPSCPFVGLAGDRTLLRSVPDDAHRCYALEPPGSPDGEYQKGFCLSRKHTQCPFYQSPEATNSLIAEADGGAGASGARRWLPILAWFLLVVLIGWVASLYLRDTPLVKTLLLSRRSPAAAAVATQAPTSPPAVAMLTPTPNKAGATQAAALSATLAVLAITGTPTPPEQAPATPRAPANAEAKSISTYTRSPESTATATMTTTPTPTPAPPTATPTRTKAATAKASAKAAARPSATAKPAQATAKQTPTPQATLTPAQPSATPPAAPASVCPDPRVQITAPKAGAAVSGLLELRGRAVHEAFAAYVLEFAPGAQPATGYEEVLRSQTAMEDGVLGAFVLSALPKGTYTVSLSVLTSQGDAPPPCRVVYQVSGR
jgi:hypothetical protein